jgi:chromosomal replication initiator protein
MKNYSDLWNEVLDKLELEFENDTFTEIFNPCSFHEFKNGSLIVIAPTEYAKNRLNKLYIHRINEIISKLVTDENIRVKIILKEEIKVENSYNKPEVGLKNKYRNNLNANYNFNNYVVGQSNMFAFRMAMKIADQPGEVANPFYIFGSVGLGKTHLMQAIGNYILDNDVKKRVLYVKASEFLEDYSKMCLGTLSNDNFNEKYRNLDVLLIDDIQTLELGKKSQLEFFKIFDILYSDNKQIVITSDRPAKELNIMERLTSRFEVGLTVDIQVPSLEHRINIIKKKLAEAGYEEVDEDVYEFIGKNFTNNIRVLEGAINRLVNYCITCELEINLENTKEALHALISTSNKRVPTDNDHYTDIIGVVADFYNISFEDITGNKRQSKIVLGRQIAMYILKNKYGLAYKKIGSFFGGKDHSTVITSVEKIENEIKLNGDVKLAVETILKKIN